MEENWNLDIDSYQKRFCTCDGATLADKDLPPTQYVIRKLLPQGLALLSGSPKVGKSWLTLDWCVKIAKGEKIWDFPTVKGTTLYLSLEDTESRLQERLLTVTEDAPSNVHFATGCMTIGDGLEEQIAPSFRSTRKPSSSQSIFFSKSAPITKSAIRLTTVRWRF